jgi:DNA-binding transcriptional ArsR family regulator
MREVLDITKSLADESRLRVLMALRAGELCVCQIIELLGLAPSTVSKHMSILRQARLVEARKDGRWMYYRLTGRKAGKPVREALAWLQRNLGQVAKIRQDERTLQKILRITPEQLCKKQNRS